MALFAGALVSLAQIVEGVDTTSTDTTTASWQALRIFLYGSIMLNLAGAFLSLLTIKMCSDLPLAYHQRQLGPGTNADIKLPAGVKDWHRSGVLLGAGMSRYYSWIDITSTLMLVAACVCTFSALAFWVLLNTLDPKTSGITMIIFGSVAIVVLGAFAITSLGERWE
jgi:ethanolamine transporter EutH